MYTIKTSKKVIRRIWSFSKALDLALIDDEIKKGFKLEIGYRHGERVGYISVRLGYLMGIRGKDLFLLLLAGLMHDIGAVGGFADYHGDYRLMEEHSELGAKIMRDFPYGETLSNALRYHHQTPKDHQNDNLMAKIISFADKLDIVMGRNTFSYRDRAKAVNYINTFNGVEFYPEVADAFMTLIGQEAFWLYLNEADLLPATLDFLFQGKDDSDRSEFGAVSGELCGDIFINKFAETFAFLIDQKSEFTGKHSRSVSQTAEALAHGLGWDDQQCKEMRLAGLLHDLGKLAIPQKILDKPGPLDEYEIKAIRTHTYYTYNLLMAAGFERNIIEWASYHHERLDGKGYPFQIEDTYLTVGARLMTIADMFTAMTEDRPYRAGMDKNKAIVIIAQGAGKSVDGQLVEVAKRVLL